MNHVSIAVKFVRSLLLQPGVDLPRQADPAAGSERGIREQIGVQVCEAEIDKIK